VRTFRRALVVAVVLGALLQSAALYAVFTHRATSSSAGMLVGMGIFAVAISVGGLIAGEGRPLAGAILGSAFSIIAGLVVLLGG
jgi:hypothetical protein